MATLDVFPRRTAAFRAPLLGAPQGHCYPHIAAETRANHSSKQAVVENHPPRRSPKAFLQFWWTAPKGLLTRRSLPQD